MHDHARTLAITCLAFLFICVGVMGGSLGAGVAYATSYKSGSRDPRIKAVVEQSGAGPPGTDTYPVGSIPLMLMHGTADPSVPYAWSVHDFGVARTPKYLVTLLGAKHIQYDEPWLSISTRASIDFFDGYLKGQDDRLHQLSTDTNVPGKARLQQG